MDKKILLLLFLVSGFAFSQTTVTLQDQCNCEVLSGTAVTSPGLTTPSGADTGDIYVNTNTGVIYFWDGDSWELTSSDDQLLQNFSFNAGTNILSLDIEDGNTVNVDLSSLSGTGTDDQLLSLAGNILTLEDGGTVDLSSYLDNTDDQIITAFSIDASNILTLTLEDGNTQTVDLSGLVGTDDQLISLAGNILALEDGGNVDLSSYLDNTDDQIITAFSIDAGNTLTLTLEDGNTQTVDLSGLVGTDDQTAAEVTYDNTASGLTAIDVQAAIDEINAAAGTVALVDNLDGTYDFTDAGGNTTTITDTSISTLVDNADGTYTYTDETGATQIIDTNASSNPYDNTVSGLVALNVQDAIDEINAAAGTVSLVDNLDGTYDFTDAGGNTTTITDTSISTLVDNLDGTYTYTDETGATQIIDTNASSNPYDNTVSGLVALNVQDAIDEINAAAGTVALVDNLDGTYDFTDAGGNTTTITDTSISTLVDNLDGTYTYTDETGATQIIDTNASSNPYDNTVSGLVALNVQDAIDEINAAAGTVALVDNLDGTYDFTDAGGNTTTISDTSISTLVDNLDGTYTYTDETGATQTIDTNASSNPYDNTVSGLVALNVQDAIDEINAAAGTVALVDNLDGTYDFTDAGGNTTTITDTSISTLVDNLDGTYTYTDETGATQLIDTNASSNPYDNTVSGLVALNVQDAIDEINAAAGTVALVDNLDGTYDFTDAGGNTTTISDTSISTLVDNLDGTYTYTDETGATQIIDTNASSNPYDNTVSGLTATDVQAAIDEINALAGTVALVDNLDGTYDFTDAGGNTTTISDTSISTLVDNLDGTYTYTDETGATQLIDTNASSNPYDNTVSGLTATDVQAAIDEINGLAGTVALVDNLDGTYDFTDAGGNTTTISDTSISTLVDNLDGTYTYTDETGATQVIDTNASSNPYDNTVSGLVALNVQAAIDEINALAGTVALVDNLDGTYTFTDAAGNNTTISDTSISTLVDNGNATFTYTDETGTPVTITLISADANNDIVAGSDGGLYLNVASVMIAETVTNIVDNADGTFTYTNEDGTPQTISKSDITDNGDGTYTFTNNDGSDVILDTNAISNPYDNTVSGLTAINVQAAIDELEAGSTDDQNISGSGLAGTNLTIGIENGASELVDLSSLVGTDDQTAAEVTYDNTTSGLVATDVQAAIDEINGLAGTVALVDNADGTYTFTDAGGNNTTISDTSISTMVDNADGTYTYTDETGATQNIDTNAGSNPYDNTVSGLTATDVQAAIDELEAGSTDDQNISGSGLAGTNLTIAIENGASELVDLSSLVGTDDQTAAEVTYDNTASGLTAIDVQAAIDELEAGSTDDQNISGSGLAGTNLTIAIENGASELVDLSSLVGTDDQTISTDGTAGNISIEDGNTLVLNVNDADAVVGNEYNTNVAMNAGALEVTDPGATLSTSVISADVNNNIIAGSDGALYLNVASVAIAETITNIVDNADGTFTYTNENGTPQTISKADITDNGDGTYTFTNNDGSDVVLNTNASSNPYDNTVSGLVATDVQAAIDELEAGSTDDQNISGSGLAGTNLTIAIENGASEVVDLSSLVGTDDQNISGSGLAGTNLTIAIENGASEVVDLSSLVGTDDQNIESLAVDGVTNILTVGIEDGLSQTVDLSHLDDAGTDDQTAAEVTYDNTVSGLTAIEVQSAIDELAVGSTDDQNISGSGLAGTNLTIAIENGASEVVDLSSLVGTDDQNIESLAVDGLTNILTVGIEDGVSQTVDLSHLDDAGSDDQNISGSGLAGTNLTIGIESGASEVVDLSSLVGTDDQTAAEVTYDNTTSGLTAVEVQAALDELAAGSTDDQNISGSGLAGTNLTIAIENGASEVVDLSSLVGSDDQNIESLAVDGVTNILTVGIEDGVSQTVDLSHLDDAGTDDQTISTDNTPGNISIEDGNTLTLNVDDADADATNEYNTSVGTNAGALEVTDGGGTLSTTMISTDANNDIAAGSDGALYLNVASVTISETITNLVDNADGTMTYTNENGVPQTVSKADITDNANGTYTFTNNDGSDVILDTNAGSNPYDNTTSGLIATDVQAALDELATGSTDDQNISGSGLAGTNLTIGIESGASEVVDLSSLVGTDDQTAAEVTYDNTVSGLTAVEVQSAIDELAAGSTDDQNISGSGLAGTNLTIGIESGASEVVDLSSLVGSDDQNIESLAVDGLTNILTVGIEDGVSQTVDLSHLDDSGTDDQNISGSGLAGTNLTIGIESGASEVVDLSSLVGSDDQNISGSGLAGNILTIGIENGTNETVDLSALVGSDDQNIESLAVDGLTNILTVGIEDGVSQTVDLSHLDDSGTDDQTAAEVTYDNTVSGLTAVEVQSAIDELAAGSTDDQNISGSGLAGTNLTIGIESGASEVVDLSSLVGSDDQNISGSGLVGTNLTIGIESGASEVVDLSSLVGTDDQNIQSLAVDGLTNILTVGIEDGVSQTVDLSHLDDAGTDDQNISGSALVGTNLTIGIESGASEVVDLSSLVGTDDQAISLVGNTLTLEDGGTVDLAPYLDNTDDQNISGSGLVGTNLTIGIESGASEVVDLSSLVGTDDQNIQSLAVDGLTNILTVGIEDGVSQTVDLSHLDDAGTDDQNISGSALVGTNLTIGIESGASEVVDLSSLVGTDDQNISGSGLVGTNLTIGIESGASEVVDLSSLVGTDDQNIQSLAVDGLTNILTVGIEDGVSQTVDLSHLDDAGTDDQNISGSALVGTNLTIGIESGASEVVDLSSLVGTDDQAISLVGNTLTLEDGGTVDLAPYLDNTDDQNISGSGLVGTNLTIGIESGASEVVDLSSLVGTDDQNIQSLAVDGLTNILTVGIEDGVSQTVDLSHLDDAGTDDQNISGSALVGTNLTIGIESGASEVVDLSSLVGTDDQNISGSGLVGTNLTIGIESGASEVVDLSSLVGTDDQNIQSLAVDGLTNILTVGIEDGVSQTVDLSHLDDAGTDDQNLTGASLSGANILQIDIENGASTTVDLSSLSDSETITNLAQNTTTGVITYTNESATPQTANVVSTDANNQISVGSDGGAYLNMPVTYSAGKINGNGTAASIYQATVARINEGDYQITFNTALSNANYIIQLATLDCNGDCPGNTTGNYDDPGITYYDQQTTGFKVNIGDSDNGTTAKDDIDLEFMYVVIKLP